eukprot:720284-Prorocentrum_minimum.AAC.2
MLGGGWTLRDCHRQVLLQHFPDLAVGLRGGLRADARGRLDPLRADAKGGLDPLRADVRCSVGDLDPLRADMMSRGG